MLTVESVSDATTLISLICRGTQFVQQITEQDLTHLHVIKPHSKFQVKENPQFMVKLIHSS